MKIKVKLPSSKHMEFLVKGTKATFGRSSKADIAIADEALSRIHCLLESNNNAFFVTDLGSANGVYLNDERLPAHSKTPFTTFQVLMIGQMEVQVSDDKDAEEFISHNNSSKIQIPTHIDISPTRPTRIMNRDALNKTLPKTSQKKSQKAKLTFPLIVLIVAFFYIGHELTLKIKAPPTVIPPHIKNTPVTLKNVSSVFLSISDYEVKDKQKSCSDPSICESLGLKVTDGEGVAFEGQEAFIFIRPDLKSNHDKFKHYTKDDAPKLIAIYQTLKSNLFARFQAKDLGQLHIILKNKDLNIYKVFRLHTSRFSQGGPEKDMLLTDLTLAFKNGSSDVFWATARPLVESKDL